MNRLIGSAIGLLLAAGWSGQSILRAAEFRPPSVPLIAHDPYFSVWSPADKLTDAWPVHWTGKRHAMQSMARVDGKAYRLMGPDPAAVPALRQSGLTVTATRSIYTFASDEVKIIFTFMSPLLPNDLDTLSRPVTYLTWTAQSQDGRPHLVSIYLEVSPELSVNQPSQPVVWSQTETDNLNVLRAGAAEQRVLARAGDDLRIEWGYLYLAAQKSHDVHATIAPSATTRGAFADNKDLPAAEDGKTPRPAADAPVLALTFDLDLVGAEPASRFAMVAYDDLASIRYFGTQLKPYWRQKNADADAMLRTALTAYFNLVQRCPQFDDNLADDLTTAGGPKYAQICALAYRQCMAANKIVADANGQPLMFPKENFSNGCIATVDVIYPAAPQFLLLSPAMMKASLVPVLDYAASPYWKFPFAPHDLGTYPFAEGQVYGDGENGEGNQMPVEESGNMLLMMAAVAQIEGNAGFSAKYWPVLSKWADYLAGKGFDPEKQLCTDDFAGHLAHNVNLSAKAILALGAYAKLAEQLDKKDVAAAFRKTAEQFAARWVKDADDGDHFKLAFDKPGTWSQKYNLAWDRILGLNLFGPEAAAKEMAYYRKMQKPNGLPLDNRKSYTKLDWITWTATLTHSREDFEALVNPVWNFLNTAPDRVPMTDWYDTVSGKQEGFQARSVVGGVFLRMLDDQAVWRKWAARATKVEGNWAPMPKRPPGS